MASTATHLVPLAPGSLWTVEQPFRLFGLPLGARMTIVRLGSGELWVHSPLETDPELRREIDALGPVRSIVAPCRFHYRCAGGFHSHYPDARVYGSPGLDAKKTGLPLAGTLGDEADPAWGGEIDQAVLRGHALLDEVAFFHRPSRTLIVADLLMSIHADAPPHARLGARLLGIYERPGLPVEMRFTFRDRDAARGSLRKILAWDFDRVVLSHGHLIPSGGKEAVRSAYGFLLGR